MKSDRRLWWARLALVASLGGWLAGAACADTAAGVRIGVQQLAAAPVPGAKPRTPLRVEAWLAQQASQEGLLASSPVQWHWQVVKPEAAWRALSEGTLDVWLGVLPASASVPAGFEAHSLAWDTAAMAIMRTDTDIVSWDALSQRTVCLAADGRHVGEMARRFGAQEQVYPAAADALLALRIGDCDAAVMDHDFLRRVLAFPEWQKFSARLLPQEEQQLTLVSRADVGAERRRTKGSQPLWRTLFDAVRQDGFARQQAQDIAFEVYLDQTVPDCH